MAHWSTQSLSWSQTREFQSAVKLRGQAGLAQVPEPDQVPDSFLLNNLQDGARQAELGQVVSHPTAEGSNSRQRIQSRPESMAEIPTTPQHVFASMPILEYHRGTKFDRVPYWRKISRWKDVTEKEFLSYEWSVGLLQSKAEAFADNRYQLANNVQGKEALRKFLQAEVPYTIPFSSRYEHITTRDDFIKDVMDGVDMAPMSIRLPPHILASIDWSDPLNDPLRLQFIPMKCTFQPDHPMLSLDSLHEREDSPCLGLVHRYTDKCLFLGAFLCLDLGKRDTLI